MNRYFKLLIDIFNKNHVSDISIFDADRNRIYGEPGGVYFKIEYDVRKQKWRARYVDMDRGTLYDEAYALNEREICIAFIKMTEEYLHLSQHLPEFD